MNYQDAKALKAASLQTPSEVRIFATTIFFWTNRATRSSRLLTALPSAFGRSAARRCARSATFAAYNASSTNDAGFVTPTDMLAELRNDNRELVVKLRETHDLCDEHGDVASASLLENWIDEADRRVWFLYESTRGSQ
jgi:hypothetical protein